MLKDFFKTFISVTTIILVIILYFIISANVKKGVQSLTRTQLALNDPTIIIIENRIKNNSDLRMARLIPKDLDSDSLVKFIVTKMNKEDYTSKTIIPTKIVCEVNSNITFISSSDCHIRIISNDKINEYQHTLFNIDNELEFNEFEYKGLNCQNDGNKYYCLEYEYYDNIIDYSVIVNAYEEKNKVVVHEYYLRINLGDNDRCYKYFNKDYCTNYQNLEKPILTEDIIKQDGVLYEDIFVRSNNNLYLSESFLLSER